MFEQDKWEFNDMTHNKIEDLINKNETVLYRTQPKKSAYVWSAIFRMMPIVLIWIAFDGFAISMFFSNGEFVNMSSTNRIMIIVFFIFHLLPVWIWIGGIIKATLEYKNVDYAITDKRIIMRNGIIGIDFKMINYNEIDSINVKVGVIDRILKVGDIYIKHGNRISVIYDISHPYEILNKLQKITLDIKADIHYPNDIRPKENHGYNTSYNG